MKPPSTARERINLQWAEAQARRLAMEERARMERRALAWRMNGAAAGFGS